MAKTCTSSECSKNYNTFKCHKCKLIFCQWHILFTENVAKNPECICCYFAITRTSNYQDAPISDELAEGLLSANLDLRNRVIKYQLTYDLKQEENLRTEGYSFFGMMPPPDPDVKEFCLRHRK